MTTDQFNGGDGARDVGTADAGLAADRAAIRDLIEGWAVWRDGGDWDRFASVWHDDAWMMTTWSRSPATDFMVRSRAAFERGLEVMHMLGGSAIEVCGNRAVAETKTEILQRGEVHGVRVDVECKGRFIDALEKREGRWGIVFRQPVYDLDRMCPVNPAEKVELDEAILCRFPAGYRHLAYLQSVQGMNVYDDMPGTRGEGIERLRAVMATWLGGEAVDFLQGKIALAAKA